MNDLPLLDATDLAILEHRDAHFGGSFEVMLDYYAKEGVGTMEDFEERRIAELAHIEKDLRQNLSEVMLSEAAHVEIEKAKQLYLDLREVYEKDPMDAHAILISNLILDEEDYPEEAIEAIVQAGSEMVDLLIDIVDSELFYDPLAPGYGRCPIFAAEALGKLGDPKAIPHLFRSLSRENFDTDEAMVKALKALNAKEFLLKRLSQLPFSAENEQAAIALMEFSDDPDVATHCLNLLENPDIFKHPQLATYLVFGCSSLQKPEEKERFKALFEKQSAKSSIKREMQTVLANYS